MSVIVVSYFFSDICGSKMAEVSALGSALMGPLKRAGYRPEDGASLIASGTAMGMLVPPAIFMIVISAVTNQSAVALFLAGFLFFIGFARATAAYQARLDVRTPMLVGFFLAGLVIHGGLQGWWIAPVLGSLAEIPLFLTATALTAFNDNALITYLATLVKTRRIGETVTP